MERGASGTPDATVESFGGVEGLIQQNTEEGSFPLDNSSETLTKASFLLLLGMVKYQYNDCSSPCGLGLRLGCWV